MRSGWAGEFMGSSMPDVESLIGLSCPLEARVMWNAGIGKPKKKVTTGMGTIRFNKTQKQTHGKNLLRKRLRLQDPQLVQVVVLQCSHTKRLVNFFVA